LPFEGFFFLRTAELDLQYTANETVHINTVCVVIQLGTTVYISLRTRNPREEKLFCWELLTLGLGMYRRNSYSAGNHQLMNEESTREIRFCWELQAHG
jgi:hypothetical protein